MVSKSASRGVTPLADRRLIEDAQLDHGAETTPAAPGLVCPLPIPTPPNLRCHPWEPPDRSRGRKRGCRGLKSGSRPSPGRRFSAADRALGVDVDRVERLAGRHEQAVALQPAEAQIGAALGQCDAADHRAVGGENRDPVQGLAHPPAAPQIAVDIAAEAVGRAVAEIGEVARVGEAGAVGDDIEDGDRARPGSRFDDVNARFVGREGEAVRAAQPFGNDGGAPGAPVDAIDVGRQFRLGPGALVIAGDAENRIGEPHRPVRFDDDIVGRVERLVLEAVANVRDRAVVLGPGDPPHPVLAGDEAPLAVAGVAVGVVRRLPEDRGLAGFLVPSEDAVVGNVAPQHAPLIADPHRAFAPAAAGVKPLDRGIHRRPQRLETRVEGDDCRVGIGLGGLPSSHCRSPSGTVRYRARRCGEHAAFPPAAQEARTAGE